MVRYLKFKLFVLTTMVSLVTHAVGGFTETGSIRLVIIDTPKHDLQHEYYFVSDQDSITKRLIWDDAPATIQSGSRVQLDLVPRGNKLEVADFKLLPKPKKEVAPQKQDTPLVQKILVVPVRFSQRPDEFPCDQTYLKNLFYAPAEYGSVISLYDQVTRGQLHFEADIMEPVSIAANPDTCDHAQWSDRVDQKLYKQRGIISFAYSKRIYIFPQSSKCTTVAGYGELGSYPGSQESFRSWIWDGCYSHQASVNLIAHEIGHNFGLNHANTIDDEGNISEYGDVSDFMGAPDENPRLLNANHTQFLGFIPSLDTETMPLESAGSHMVTLNAVNLDVVGPSNGPRLLKIPISNNEFYFVSFRGPQGYDAGLGSEYKQKLSIHRNSEFDSSSSLVRTLDDGESFLDTKHQVTIKMDSHTEQDANITVTFNPICKPSLPKISLDRKKLQIDLSPDFDSNPWNIFELSVTNTDQACGTRQFSISIEAPLELNTISDTDKFTLESGRKQRVIVNIFPVRGIQAGRYPVTFTVRDNEGRKTKIRGIVSVIN